MCIESRNFHSLLLYLFFCLLYPSSSYATDTITSSQPLRDGETLISANQTFELGFFTPNKLQNRYIGIWYKKVPDRKVVWVANPENPITSSPGLLTIAGDGNLVLLDASQTVVWSTNASDSLENHTTIAVLTDMGDLVLKEADPESSSYLWKSFNHPGNSLLQNMKIVVNLKTHEKIFIHSWRSEEDPKTGNYTFGIDPKKPAQAFLWNGSVPYWRSGQWDGRQFTGLPETAKNSVYFDGPSLVTDYHTQMFYFTFTLYNSSLISVFEMGSSGILSKLDWDDGKEEWISNWRAPGHECDVYAKCGVFGSCYRFDSPICGCLRGFQPKYEEKWRMGDWSDGCVRRTGLNCSGSNDGFEKIEKVKLPDFGDYLDTSDEKECESKCLNNCSCVAYAVVGGIGCLRWGGGLIDIQQFSSGGSEIFIRLASSELGGKRKHTAVIFVVLMNLLAVVCLASFAFLCFWCMVKMKKGKKIKIHGIHSLGGVMEASNGSRNANIIRDGGIHGGVPELLLFDLSDIAIATNNFSVANKLGQGGFGPVYKGLLPDGQEIAVKRLSKSSGQGLEEFKNEVIFISKLQHRNLVRLLGCCIEEEEKIVVYEYMPNRSLDSVLFDKIKRRQLDWAKRFDIIEGVARGLLYLHRDSRLRIIHRDLKASNILLDEEMNPKISDFGLAWSSGEIQNLAKTDRVAGTYSYMAPEYVAEGRFSEKSDVFSFGVLVLEIVSGKRNSSFYNEDQSLNLLRYAWQLWNGDRAVDLIDPSLHDSCSQIEVMRCMHVGLLCVQERASDRPNMSTIVFMLGSEIINFPTPMHPGFTLERSPEQSSLPFLRNICSVNDVSVTRVEGR